MIASSARLVFREMEGEVLVYNSSSAETHWLAPHAGLLLREVARQPISRQNAIALLSGSGFCPDDASSEHFLDECLSHFEQTGLIDHPEETLDK